ncbi:MAG TPA: hypothetical protein VK196_12205, partial [Magnetospirillum sp.]|nr:hypothetical protein [Magnetospirillum sp.]
MDESLLVLLALGSLIVAFVAITQSHRVDSDLKAVRRRLAELENRVVRLGEAGVAPPPPVAEAVTPEPEKPAA